MSIDRDGAIAPLYHNYGSCLQSSGDTSYFTSRKQKPQSFTEADGLHTTCVRWENP